MQGAAVVLMLTEAGVLSCLAYHSRLCRCANDVGHELCYRRGLLPGLLQGCMAPANARILTAPVACRFVLVQHIVLTDAGEQACYAVGSLPGARQGDGVCLMTETGYGGILMLRSCRPVPRAKAAAPRATWLLPGGAP